MKMFHKIFLMIVLGSGWLMADDSRSVESQVLKKPMITDESLFREDICGVQQLGGVIMSPIGSSKRRTFNYAPSITRFTWMLTTPDDNDAWFRGNVEVALDLFAAGIFDGPGDVIIGPTGLVRYNFVQPGWKLVPYIQGGAGIVYTDAYQDHSQRLIGQAIEFTPQASLGARYLVDHNWSVTAEFMFHHISNRDMADRNVGVNAFGGMIGFSYLFDPRQK